MTRTELALTAIAVLSINALALWHFDAHAVMQALNGAGLGIWFSVFCNPLDPA